MLQINHICIENTTDAVISLSRNSDCEVDPRMRLHHPSTAQLSVARLGEKALWFLKFQGVRVGSIKVGMKYAVTITCDDFRLFRSTSTKLLLGRCGWETRFDECSADLCEVLDELPNL